jgi:hypothetical protein
MGAGDEHSTRTAQEAPGMRAEFNQEASYAAA